MSELPSWPDMNSFRNSNKYITRVAEIMYERARAEAALARLRVAVEMLKEIADNPGYDNSYSLDARETLATIGDLP